MKRREFMKSGLLRLGAGTLGLAGFGQTESNALSSKGDFYVAIGGRDSNPGMASAPFPTRGGARDAVRKIVFAGLTGDILLVIRGGTSQQTKTLTFGPQDSVTEKY